MKPVAGIKFLLNCILLQTFSILSIQAQTKEKDTVLAHLLAGRPDLFASLLAPGNDHQIQIIYTQIDRSKKGKPQFREHSFGLDTGNYFYPASTVKLPIAILALQKLNELNIPGLNRNSTMITGAEGNRQTTVHNDPSAPNGSPSITHYIKKILLVSDNDAFNRLYEFLGQEYINQTLHRMGYAEVQIIHRLEISLSEEDNRHTNPVSFYDSSGKLVYQKPAERSKLVYAERNTRMGKGFMRAGQLVNEPFDFSRKNRLGLASLNNIVRSILFPEAVEDEQRFNLSADDYAFLRKYMSMLPGESLWPKYDSNEYWDTYVKFLYYGAVKNTADPFIRSFNKVGDAYGFLIDAAYIIDRKNRIEFQLSAIIHCNSDGIYNDDRYEYSSIGLPFMKDLGHIIYEYELKRKRKHLPDLSPLDFKYRE